MVRIGTMPPDPTDEPKDFNEQTADPDDPGAGGSQSDEPKDLNAHTEAKHVLNAVGEHRLHHTCYITLQDQKVRHM